MYEEALHNFAGHGITFKDVKVDLDTMMKQKSKAVDVLTKGIEGNTVVFMSSHLTFNFRSL